MPVTPGVTLTANLETILAAGGAGVRLGGYLRITLCGFGPVLPRIPGVGMLANAGIPQFVGPQLSTALSQLLWGNDVITPAATFYEIAILDQDKNVIQTGLYQFANAAGAVDLSQATQIVGPFGFQLPTISGQPCTGTVPGSAFTAPGIPIAVFYNGSYLPQGRTYPVLSYTAVAQAITLNFVTEVGDRIDALCIL
jgi:hypothetical protein